MCHIYIFYKCLPVCPCPIRVRIFVGPKLCLCLKEVESAWQGSSETKLRQVMGEIKGRPTLNAACGQCFKF